MDLPDIRLIRADNASPLTGSGTNTWLLGRGKVTVIDPGPALAPHLEAILAATRGEEIGHILVTHAHLDHSELAAPLAQKTGAQVLAFGQADAGRSAVMARLAREGLTSGEGADPGFAPDRCLADGEVLHLPGLVIEALHMPGHMGCHMGFALGDVLFSGDHVMGWSSSLVSPPDGDMGDYMRSLAQLRGRAWSRFLPGHGPEVADPSGRLAELTAHRKAREAAILAELRRGPATPDQIAAQVYSDTPKPLLPAAARNVLAHLIDLTERGLARPGSGSLAGATFSAR